MGQAGSRSEEFWEACSYGREWLVKQMIEEGNIDVNWVSNVHSSRPIHVASQGFPGILKLLLDANAQVDALDTNGNTALHHVSLRGYYNCAEILLAHGSNINAQNNNNWTPLMNACYWNKFDIVQLMIANKCDVFIRNKLGRTALHELCRSKKYETQSKLDLSTYVQENCGLQGTEILNLVKRHTQENDDMMHHDNHVTQSGDLSSVASIHNVPVNTEVKLNQRGNGPVQIISNSDVDKYIEQAEISLVQILRLFMTLDDIDINMKCSNSNSWDSEADFTPLMFACYHNHIPLVKEILSYNADMSIQDCNGWTALHWVVNKCNYELIRILLSCGADATIQNNRGNTALHLHIEKMGTCYMDNVRNESEQILDRDILALLSASNSFSYPDVVTRGSVSTDDEENVESSILSNW